jgi:hypothetical protein
MSYIANSESSVKSKQTIFRSNPEHGYTKLSNAMLQDSRLSYDTRGLLGELLSRPDDWEITVISIVKRGGAGRDKVYRMFKELHALGYAKVDQDRNDGGKFEKQRYWVTDDPQFMIAQTARELDKLIPLPENTETVVPFPEKPEAVKRARMAENSQLSPLTEKPETAEPLTAEPLTGLPLTANPTHTNKRELQRKETTKGDEGQREGIGRTVGKAMMAAGAAVIPAYEAAAQPIEPPAIVQQDVAACWQTAKAHMAAGMNSYEAVAQRQIWITPTGCVEVAGEFRTELERVYTHVDLVSGLSAAAPNVSRETTALHAMQQVRRQFGYMQQDALKRAAKTQSEKPPIVSKPKPKASLNGFVKPAWETDRW